MNQTYTERRRTLMLDNMADHVGVVHLHTNGRFDILNTENKPSLYWWQSMVGGRIEIIEVQALFGHTLIELSQRGYVPRVLLVVNEEGRLLGLAENQLASTAACASIVGPAVICAECVMEDGEADIVPMPMDILLDVLYQIT